MAPNNVTPAQLLASMEAQLKRTQEQASMVTQLLAAWMVKQGWADITITDEDMEAAWDQNGFRVQTNWITRDDGSRKCVVSTVPFTESELADIAKRREEAKQAAEAERDDASVVKMLASVGAVVPLETVAGWSTFQWMIAEGWAQKMLDDPTANVPMHLQEFIV